MSPAGRPRKIDPDIALARALDVFWEKGYAQTSMSDLIDATGLHKGSLYSAFGDKESLFLHCLRAYIEKMRTGLLLELEQESDPLLALRNTLIYMVEVFTSNGCDSSGARGCLAMKTLTQSPCISPEVNEFVASSNAELFELLQSLLERVSEDAKHSLNHSVKVSALLIATTLSGLCAQVMSSMTKQQALDLVDAQLELLISH